MLGRKTFARQGRTVLYAAFKSERADAILKELSFIDKTFVGFFGGKILDSAIVGLICYVFCMIMTRADGTAPMYGPKYGITFVTPTMTLINMAFGKPMVKVIIMQNT